MSSNNKLDQEINKPVAADSVMIVLVQTFPFSMMLTLVVVILLPDAFIQSRLQVGEQKGKYDNSTFTFDFIGFL